MMPFFSLSYMTVPSIILVYVPSTRSFVKLFDIKVIAKAVFPIFHGHPFNDLYYPLSTIRKVEMRLTIEQNLQIHKYVFYIYRPFNIKTI